MNEYKSVAPYGQGPDDLVALSDRLRDIAYAGLQSARHEVPAGRDPNGERLWRRLDGLCRWHQGQGIDAGLPTV